MVFVHKALESLFSFSLFFGLCSFLPQLNWAARRFTTLECIAQFQWDLPESGLLASLR